MDEQEFYNNVEPSDMLSVQKDLMCSKNLHETSNSHIVSSNHNVLPSRVIEEYVLQGAVPKHAVELYKESSNNLLDKNTSKLVANNSAMKDIREKQQLPLNAYNEELLSQKMSALQVKLEEATKTISVERE